VNDDPVSIFEKEISEFFGAPYGIAVDCCTYGLELCLRHVAPSSIAIPCRTALPIPFLANKLKLDWEWKDENWTGCYELGTSKIYDAAVLWGANAYIKGSLMVISFQPLKHLEIGRGGMILTDNAKAAQILKEMSYDGWRGKKDVRSIYGEPEEYHYYMMPSTAEIGLHRLPDAIQRKPKHRVVTEWPDLSKEKIYTTDLANTKEYYGLQ